jgi:tetratricopeptide (TPR) repeat protein
LQDARALAATADAEGFTDLAPRAHLMCAMLANSTGELEAAVASASTTIERADVVGDDLRRAEAEMLLVNVLAQKPDLERAFEWVGLARATLVRLGDPIELRAKLSGYEGYALHVAGRFDEALVRRREALELRQESSDELDPALATAYSNLGLELLAVGERQAAREQFMIALDIQVRALGELHPDVARTHSDLGGALGYLGDTDAAVREFQLAIDILTMAVGPDHPSVGRAYVNLGNTVAIGRDRPKAAPLYERGIAILERARGRDNAEVAAALGNYGRLLADMPMPAPLQAIDVLTRARTIEVASLGPDNPELCYIDNHLAVAYIAAGQLDAAATAAASSLRIATAAHGSRHPMVAQAWFNTGNVAAARHDTHAAVTAYETALAVQEALDLRPAEPALTRFLLAQVLAESGELPRAVALARAAQQGFLADGPDVVEYVREVDAWLAAHE